MFKLKLLYYHPIKPTRNIYKKLLFNHTYKNKRACVPKVFSILLRLCVVEQTWI